MGHHTWLFWCIFEDNLGPDLQGYVSSSSKLFWLLSFVPTCMASWVQWPANISLRALHNDTFPQKILKPTQPKYLSSMASSVMVYVCLLITNKVISDSLPCKFSKDMLSKTNQKGFSGRPGFLGNLLWPIHIFVLLQASSWLKLINHHNLFKWQWLLDS